MPPDVSTILLIEDDSTDALLFQRVVRKANLPFQIHVAGNGQEAIDYLEGAESSSLPKLIITDNKMPLLSGTEFLKWLKNHPRYSVVPTVVLGGSRLSKDMEDAYHDLGVHSYFLKPLTVEQLQRITAIITNDT